MEEYVRLLFEYFFQFPQLSALPTSSVSSNAMLCNVYSPLKKDSVFSSVVIVSINCTVGSNKFMYWALL